jgi:hypothetical protein
MGVIRHWLSYHIGTSTGPAYIDAVARAELRRGLAHVVAAAHWLLPDVDFAIAMLNGALPASCYLSVARSVPV